MWSVFVDALLDTLILLPFLFLLYLLIEIMEHNTRVGKPRKSLTGKWAPAIGAGLGLVPMCGFSVMAAKLYEHRHVTVGTLVAVFVTTSDEALLVLLLSDMGWAPKLISLALLTGIKFVLAIAVGYAVDAMFSEKHMSLAPLPEEHHEHMHDHEHGHHVQGNAHETAHEHMQHMHDETQDDHESGDCECADLSPCEHKKESKLSLYVLSPLLHALQVAAFILLVNFAFGLLFYLVGEEKVLGFMQGTGYWLQPALCALIGLIPNCASSVVLAEAYALGGIEFGGLLAGLVTGAGLGYIVLMHRDCRKRGLVVLAFLLFLGIAAGYIASAVCLAL